MMKSVFYNEAESNIRAGWRMGIFVAVLSAVTFILNFPAKLILPYLRFLPTFASGEFVFYSALLLTTWGVVKFLEGRPPFASIGFPAHGNILRELGQGVAIGGGMMTIIFVAESSLGMAALSFKSLTFFHAARLTGESLLIFALGAFGEELLFRGYLFQTMVEGTGKTIAVCAFACFFGAAHLGNPNVTFFSLVNVALAGAWLAFAYFKTRTLWFPIALHFSWNFFQNHIFSFPVSGIQFEKYQLGVLKQSGPVWLTGGTFGPEGGALATIILILSGAFIYFSDWIKRSNGAWTFEQWNAGTDDVPADGAGAKPNTEPSQQPL